MHKDPKEGVLVLVVLVVVARDDGRARDERERYGRVREEKDAEEQRQG